MKKDRLPLTANWDDYDLARSTKFQVTGVT